MYVVNTYVGGLWNRVFEFEISLCYHGVSELVLDPAKDESSSILQSTNEKLGK